MTSLTSHTKAQYWIFGISSSRTRLCCARTCAWAPQDAQVLKSLVLVLTLTAIVWKWNLKLRDSSKVTTSWAATAIFSISEFPQSSDDRHGVIQTRNHEYRRSLLGPYNKVNMYIICIRTGVFAIFPRLCQTYHHYTFLKQHTFMTLRSQRVLYWEKISRFSIFYGRVQHFIWIFYGQVLTKTVSPNIVNRYLFWFHIYTNALFLAIYIWPSEDFTMTFELIFYVIVTYFSCDPT